MSPMPRHHMPCLIAALSALGAPGMRAQSPALAGHWVIAFRPAGHSGPSSARGTATLDLGVVTDPHRGRVIEGPYTLALGSLARPDPCLTLQGKARLVRTGTRTVQVDFHQGFNCGIQVSGVVRGDSVVGSWYQRSPKGRLAHGTFVMRRR